MASTIVTIATLLCVWLPAAHAYGWWIDQPYEDLGEYNTNAEYLTNVTLACDANAPDNGNIFQYWILPDMTMADTTYSLWFSTFKDGPAGWAVTNEGEMNIINVHEEHFGFYTCLAQKSGDPDPVAFKYGLNADGAYFPDPWAKYKKQTLVAIGATGIFLAVVISMCLLYNYKVYGPEERKKKEEKAKAGEMAVETAVPIEFPTKSMGQENPAYHLGETSTAL